MRKTEQKIIRGVIAKLFTFGLVIARSILLVPVILSNWGETKYGVWLALYSFFNLMLAIDLGHGQYISNEINQTYHVNMKKTRVLIGSALRVTFLSALVQILVLLGLYAIGFLQDIISAEAMDSYVLFWCLALLFLYRMFFGGFKGILVKLNNPTGYIDRGFYIGLFERIIEVAVLTLAALTDMSLFRLVLLFIVSKAIYALISFSFIYRWYPQFFPWWQYGSLRIGWTNYRRAFTLSFNSFLERFSNDGMNVMVSGILSSAMVPLFATTKTLSNFAYQLSGLVLQPFQPELSRYYAKGELEKVKTAVQLNWLFAGLVICMPFLLISPVVGHFYEIWTAGKLDFQPILYAFLVVGILLFNYGNSYVTYLASINDIPALFKITALRGITICVVGFILMKIYGLVGLGFAVAVTEGITSLFVPSYFVRERLKKHKVFLSRKLRLTAVVPVIVTSVYHLLYFVFSFPAPLVLAVASALILFSSRLQWQQIDETVRQRIVAMLPLKKFFG